MEAFHDIIAGSEEWLMERVLQYARQYGYSAYTSTLSEAWRASIAGLSIPIIAALRTDEQIQPLRADRDFAADPVARFGVEEAKKHRERGVTFTLFLGLMKYYRRAYIDLLLQTGYPPAEAAASRERLDNFFDRMELGFSSEWFKLNQTELIRELQQTNLQITSEKNKYLTIFESLPNPVLFVSRENRVVNLNHAAISLFYETALAGSYYYSGVDLDPPQPLAYDIKSFADGTVTSLRLEKEVSTNEGKRQYIVIIQRVLDVSGKFNGTVVILNDITHLRLLEEEIELLNTDLAERAFQLEYVNRDLEAFNYSVSHDLRSPLTGISGYCQLLLGAPGEHIHNECKGYIQEINKLCNRMNQFITVMLEFSRLSRANVRREQVDLSTMAEAISDNLRHEDPDRDVEVVIAAGVSASGDPQLLRVVLENLLGNAWKYTAKKKDARIEFGAIEQEGEVVYFVRDNGVGFDPAQADKLFIPFQRLHDSQEYRGVGVGLASVERIVARHGGRIWAEGLPEKGATLYFTLPDGK